MPDIPPELPFIVFTGKQSSSSETRKLIRSHVMLGKNQKQPRITSSRKLLNHQDAPEPAQPLPKIPGSIGTDGSLVRLADDVEPSAVADLFRFSSVAEAGSSLGGCFEVDMRQKVKTWLEPLTCDAAYLNVMCISTQAYYDLVLARQRSATSKQIANLRYSKTLRLLRVTMSSGGKEKFTTSTLTTILVLTAMAHMTSQFETASHHIAGLFQIINIMGGLATFRHETKLLMEILRVDIALAIHCGYSPIFNQSTPFLIQQPTPPLHINKAYLEDGGYDISYLLDVLNRELAVIWIALANFCSLVAAATESKKKLSENALLVKLSPAIYRLIQLQFPDGSHDEAMRLGMLAFSYPVFLQWQYIKPLNSRFASAYRKCLDEICCSRVADKHQLLWLLVIGAVSIFDDPSNLASVKPQIKLTLELCGMPSWSQSRAILRSFLWIDIIHDKSASDVFHSAF